MPYSMWMNMFRCGIACLVLLLHTQAFARHQALSLGTAAVAKRITASSLQLVAESPSETLSVLVAEYMAAMASVSYCMDHKKIQDWNCSRCQEYSRIKDFMPSRLQYDTSWDLLMYAGFSAALQAVVLVFRGTNPLDLDTWMHNADGATIAHPVAEGARVHAGFYTMFTKSTMQQSAISEAHALLARHPSAALYITGHSLGAAFVTLAAVDPALGRWSSRMSVITFGSPRVGNRVFAAHFNQLVPVSWRFVHDMDTVCSIPLQIMGYHHVAREVWEVGGVLMVCDSSGEDSECQNGRCLDAVCPSIWDHASYLGFPTGPGVDC